MHAKSIYVTFDYLFYSFSDSCTFHYFIIIPLLLMLTVFIIQRL
jgi:hypothetical protein